MAEEVQLTVKYLSSPKLLRLQLQDAALRRHFLVQVHPHPPQCALLPSHACMCTMLQDGALRRYFCTPAHPPNAPLMRSSPAACWPDHPAAPAGGCPVLAYSDALLPLWLPIAFLALHASTQTQYKTLQPPPAQAALEDS